MAPLLPGTAAGEADDCWLQMMMQTVAVRRTKCDNEAIGTDRFNRSMMSSLFRRSGAPLYWRHTQTHALSRLRDTVICSLFISWLNMNAGLPWQNPFSRHWWPIEYVTIKQSANYTVSQKGATLTMAITLSILGGFAKFFHCCKQH